MQTYPVTSWPGLVDDGLHHYAQPYGHPAYGQAAYGQPAYGQPAYGQPAYGQPAYGQGQQCPESADRSRLQLSETNELVFQLW